MGLKFWEGKKANLILVLENSDSFAQTHAAIGKCKICFDLEKGLLSI